MCLYLYLQTLKKKYDMGYLQPSWLGRKWQPWYQDLLDLAGVKGLPSAGASRLQCVGKPDLTVCLWLGTVALL